MMFEFHYQPRRLDLLPVLAFDTVECEDCDEVHGITLEICWLFWGVRVGVVF